MPSAARSTAESPAPPAGGAPGEPADPRPPGATPTLDAPDRSGLAKIAAAPWVLSTYFAEGLPFSIVRQMSSEIWTAFGARLEDNGLTSLYGLAWNFKFLWSPLVDRYGTLRRWMVAAEILLALIVLAIAEPAGRGDLRLVGWGFVFVALAAATHDIAVDGFYLGALDKERQTAFSGLRVAAYRAALLVGSGVLVMLAGRASWAWSFVVGGGILLGLAGAHALRLPAEQARPRAAGVRYFDAFVTFLQQPRAAATLAFIVLYNAGDTLMFAMSAPFLKDLGFQTGARGLLNVVKTVAYVTGSMSGAALITRAGLRRALSPIALGQSLAILAYVALAAARPSSPVIVGTVLFEQFAAGFGGSALVVFLMRRCAGEYKASHFAIGSALMSVASTLAGAVSGYLAARVGFTAFFLIAFAASLPGVALSKVVPKD